MAQKKKPACTVEFVTEGPGSPAAVLYDRHGRSINAANYPRGHQFTAKERTRIRRRLMAGCAELSRRRSRR
jgi:hypothetical protein